MGYERENHGFTWIYPPLIKNMAGWKIPEPNGGGLDGKIIEGCLASSDMPLG